MKWGGRANRDLVNVIVNSFGDGAVLSRAELSRATYRDWVKTYYWLDASGMALYFLDLLDKIGLGDAVPDAVYTRLCGNLQDNRARSAALLQEFISINRAFMQAGIPYCNLKGFTLTPDSCPDRNLRCQLDLDFLVDGGDLSTCAKLLTDHGYSLSWPKEDVWEFKAGSSELVRIENHYKPAPQRSVELHFAPSHPGPPSSNREDCLTRAVTRAIGGISVPVLSPADQLIGQALHLFGHLRSPCTRLAWLLEFRRHVDAHHGDRQFWIDVRKRSEVYPQAGVAIGLASALSLAIFRANTAEELDWAVQCLPHPVKLWAEQYGRRALLADFPGTKLHLLLEDALPRDNSPLQNRRVMFIPQLRPARIAIVKSTDAWPVRVAASLTQARYSLFRARFHIIQSSTYLVELPRWKRIVRNAVRRRENFVEGGVEAPGC